MSTPWSIATTPCSVRKFSSKLFRDRIDVTSPGVLPNHTTVASALAGGHPRTRNELIANYLMARGLMEVRGRGLPIIAREMREWNGTVPEMVSSNEGRFVRLTLKLAGTGSPRP